MNVPLPAHLLPRLRRVELDESMACEGCGDATTLGDLFVCTDARGGEEWRCVRCSRPQEGAR
jgi:hypothetical protein